MNIYQTEGNDCGCKEKCMCSMKKEESHKMNHHGYDKCDMDKRNRYGEKEHCPDRVKGFNLCKKINELRCFKQCQPISQPCNGDFYNYFENRTNYEFSGLVVVSNTGNPPDGCSIEVRVFDRASAGTTTTTVYPGASLPIFVEGLMTIQIACIENVSNPVVPNTCRGEIVFDLEYCATKVCR